MWVGNKRMFSPLFSLCRSIDRVTKTYGEIVRLLQAAGGNSRHVKLFHAHLDKSSELAIPLAFSKTDGLVRCLVSTIAFGLGVQVENISYVIHWGPPTSVLDYFQEIGRCARNGMPGKAILYKPPNTVRADKIEKGMMNVIKESAYSCIRYSALRALKLTALTDYEIRKLCFGDNCCEYCDRQKTRDWIWNTNKHVLISYAPHIMTYVIWNAFCDEW
jgi:superfamily II DNA helicase RecQ